MTPCLRLVVIGPESSGKTTLAQQLGAWLHAPVVPEFSRGYAERVGRPLTEHDVEPIARGQMAAEDGVPASQAAASLCVLDTDLVSTTVYAEHYYGHTAPWIMAEARKRLGALYLLTVPDLPWEADGVRDQPTAREVLHRAFSRRLAEFGACTLPVSGVGPARLEVAMAAVRGWRAAQVEAGVGAGGSSVGNRVTR